MFSLQWLFGHDKEKKRASDTSLKRLGPHQRGENRKRNRNFFVKENHHRTERRSEIKEVLSFALQKKRPRILKPNSF
ncbi:unnamed protein product [Caretta caretta]